MTAAQPQIATTSVGTDVALGNRRAESIAVWGQEEVVSWRNACGHRHTSRGAPARGDCIGERLVGVHGIASGGPLGGLSGRRAVVLTS